jgi:hypothetical protein
MSLASGTDPGGGPRTAVALFDFAGGDDSQLAFSVGDRILVKKVPEGTGWGLGELNGKAGWFPTNHVKFENSATAASGLAPASVPVSSPTPAVAVAVANPAQQRSSAAPVARDAVRAIYDYEASAADEISFQKGDIIMIVSRDGDWWKGVPPGSDSAGLFPFNYVQDDSSITSAAPAVAAGGHSRQVIL